MINTRQMALAGVLAVSLALLTTGSAKAQLPKVIEGICYGDASEGTFHQLDLYIPASKANFPVVVFAHGGAWMSGDKNAYKHLGRYFANNGVAAAVVNYRLSPKVKHPCHVEDVARAVAWTHANIGKFRGDSSRLYLCGFSAGGHLVSLIGTDTSYLRTVGLSHGSIRGVVSISGVYSPNGLPWLSYAFPAENREGYFPMQHATSKRPDFLLFHAQTEIFGLDEQARIFQSQLESSGTNVQLYPTSGTTHMSITTDTVIRERIGRRMIQFVQGEAVLARAARQ